jgi:hypothetical protein
MNSKTKGNRYELDTCKALSRWLSKGERTDLFARNVTSGGAFTTSAKKGSAQGHPGDVMGSEPSAHLFVQHLLVECKFWRDLQIESALWGRGELYKVVGKTEKQARDHDRRYMLITKQNHRPTVLFAQASVGRIITAVKPGILHHWLWRARTFVCLFDDFVQIDADAFMLALADMGDSNHADD